MADLYALPGAAFETTISGAPTGVPMGVQILADDGTVVAPRVLADEVLAGSGVYAAALTSPTTEGTYIILWDSGAITPTTTATDVLHVTYTRPTSLPSSPDFLTLDEYKSFMGIQANDTRKDAQVTALIPSVMRAVSTYTGRNFVIAAGTPTPRQFTYEGEWIIDIDDAVTVTAVSTDYGVPGQTYTLDTNQWTAMPQDDSEVLYYLLLHGGPYFGVSPEMGFERNLDQYQFTGKRPLITVTADWGWPSIPDDVKLAAALTLNALLTSNSAGRDESLTAEAIEGYSRAWGAKAGVTTAMTIPNRARDLLAGYQRIFV